MEIEQRGERLARLGEAARRAEAAWRDTITARDREVEDADRAGMGEREIARWLDMSPSSVGRILARRQAARDGG